MIRIDASGECSSSDLLVLAHPGSPGRHPESRKTVVVVIIEQASLYWYYIAVRQRAQTTCQAEKFSYFVIQR